MLMKTPKEDPMDKIRKTTNRRGNRSPLKGETKTEKSEEIESKQVKWKIMDELFWKITKTWQSLNSTKNH